MGVLGKILGVLARDAGSTSDVLGGTGSILDTAVTSFSTFSRVWLLVVGHSKKTRSHTLAVRSRINSAVGYPSTNPGCFGHNQACTGVPPELLPHNTRPPLKVEL